LFNILLPPAIRPRDSSALSGIPTESPACDAIPVPIACDTTRVPLACDGSPVPLGRDGSVVLPGRDGSPVDSWPFAFFIGV